MRGYNEYIGARYVPVFAGDWDNTKEYEPLMIVSYQGNSYTSKTFVPKNVDINDTTYWALTGNYNAQVEAYRQEVADLNDEFNDNDKLHTISKNVVNAINENMANAIFMSKRYARRDSRPDGQASFYMDGYIYSVGDDYVNNKVNVSKYNTDMVLVSHAELDINGHPNALIGLNGRLYIVDSDNHDIIIVNALTLDYIDTITDFRSYNISGISISDDNIYLLGSNVYKLSLSFELEKTINLNTINLSPFAVRQTLLVYKGLIYVIYNQPNVLVIYNMEGERIACKYIGSGNGFYPYGEIESLFVMNDDIIMSTSIYTTTTGTLTSFVQYFITNINQAISNQERVGQPTPNSLTMVVDNTNPPATKNPDGSVDNPFTSLYEAFNVLNYQIKLGTNYTDIGISGDYSNTNEVIEMSNASFSIHQGVDVKIPYLRLHNCNVILYGGSYGTIKAFGSKINLQDVIISEFDVNYCTINCGASKVTTKLKATNSSFINTPLRCEASDVTIDNISMNEFMDINGQVVDLMQAAQTINPMIAKYSFNNNSSRTTQLELLLLGDGVSFVTGFEISVGNKTTINGGGTASATRTALIRYGGNPVIITFTIKVTSTQLSIDSVSGKDLSGNDVTLTGLQLKVIPKWINRRYLG